MEFFFFPASDLCVVGFNPENADYDHPRGEIIGLTHYVVAETPTGIRKSYSIGAGPNAEKTAKNMSSALNIRMKSGRLPVGFSSWKEHTPAYGSSAYCEQHGF